MPLPASPEQGPTNPGVWRQIADATGGIVTPANGLDLVALGLAVDGCRKLDTTVGIVEAGIGFSVDMVDGAIATATDTRTEAGKVFDHVGDKLKGAIALAQIWLSGRAPSWLLAGVAANQAANAAITVYDRVADGPPQIVEATTGRRDIAMQYFGVGLNVIGHKVGETRPALGRAIRVAGSALGAVGIVRGFAVTTPNYARQARNRKPSHNLWPEQPAA